MEESNDGEEGGEGGEAEEAHTDYIFEDFLL